mgnify:CR=1 FL=1
MPRTCSICSHPQRPEIDRALLAGESLRNIAQRYGASLAALHRHKAHIAAAVQAQQAMTVERLLDDLADLQRRALALLAKAEGAGDLRGALGAIRETREVITAGAKLIEASELRKRVEDLERIVNERGAV